MTNYIKPGSQAPLKNSSASATKNIRYLDKFFYKTFYAGNQFSTVIQEGYCI